MDLSFPAHPHPHHDVTLVCSRLPVHPTSHLGVGQHFFFLKIRCLADLFLCVSFLFDLSPTSFHVLFLLIPLDFTASGKQERLICLGLSLPRETCVYCRPFDNQEMFCALTSPRVDFELGSQLPLPACASHLIHPPPTVHTTHLPQLMALSMELFWGSGLPAKLTVWMR